MNPGRTMILEKSGSPERKTQWTLAAAEYGKLTVSMYSARANDMTGKLIIPRLFPGATEIRSEYTWGRSRFDWHFLWKGKEIFLEVKACTLIEEGTAMFPDAPSIRASRHLEELAELGKGKEGHAVFVIMNPETERFIPNMHTDPEFAKTLRNVSSQVHLHGVSVSCTPEGYVSIAKTDVPVMTDKTNAVEKNCGIYLISIQMEKEILEIGALGERQFEKGWYLYAGSAKKNLKSRVSRHMRKRKRMHWHADYLIASSVKTKAFPIYTEKDLECTLVGDLMEIADDRVEGFGSSDCSCPSHLFYFRDDPLQNRDFLNLLFHYRHTLAFRDTDSFTAVLPV